MRPFVAGRAALMAETGDKKMQSPQRRHQRETEAPRHPHPRHRGAHTPRPRGASSVITQTCAPSHSSRTNAEVTGASESCRRREAQLMSPSRHGGMRGSGGGGASCGGGLAGLGRLGAGGPDRFAETDNTCASGVVVVNRGAGRRAARGWRPGGRASESGGFPCTSVSPTPGHMWPFLGCPQRWHLYGALMVRLRICK